MRRTQSIGPYDAFDLFCENRTIMLYHVLTLVTICSRLHL